MEPEKLHNFLQIMNVFQKAIKDIFNNDDFLEDCQIENTNYKCICTEVQDGVVYGDVGMVDDVSFTLNIQLPVVKMPKEGDKVFFRYKKYKISMITTDSANTSIAIHLQSLSKG